MNSEYHDLRPRRSFGRQCFIIFLGVLLFAFVVPGAIHAIREDKLENPSLEDWVGRIVRPGYRLILKQATERHYVALYDAGGSQLAIRRKDRKPDFRGAISEDVSTIEGDSVWSDELPPRNGELRKTTHLRTVGFVGTYIEHFGTMYPIRPDYSGPIRVTFKEGDEAILDEVVQWSP